MEGTVAAVEFKYTVENALLADPMVQTKISKIDKEIANMSVNAQTPAADGKTHRGGQRVSTAIIGHLDKGSSTEDAASWPYTKLSKYGVPKPINTFIKDDSYKGRLWTGFPTVETEPMGRHGAAKTDHITRGVR